MLLEVLTYLTTRCPPHLRDMGYLSELIATEARFRRCRSAWGPHLEKTQSVILSAINCTASRNKAVVLGAGLLSDIPLRALSGSFGKVVLIDVCFLHAARKAAMHYPNVEIRTSDITGLARALHAGETPESALPCDIALSDVDLVVSANVLSQLPLVPLAYLRRRHLLGEGEAARVLAHGIVRAHLDLLNTCFGTVCLISEVERQFLDGDVMLGTEDPLFGVAAEIDGDEWFWDIAPKPEASPDYAIRNRVRGMVWQGGVSGR
ncbi:MAG: hypothetical protein WD075_08010 [Rhodospirillales bacterium]